MKYSCHEFTIMIIINVTVLFLNVNDNQQNATILAYLFIPNQLYMFRAMSSPIIRSTYLAVFTASDIVHRYCRRLVSWIKWN